MISILVTGASSIVGYGILKSLRKGRFSCHLIGSSIYSDSIAPAFCDLFIQAPPTTDSSYKTWLLDALEKHAIDILIPGIEIDTHEWPTYISELQDIGKVCVLNNPNLIELCQDKWLFFEWLKHEKSPYAIPTQLSNDFDSLVCELGLPFIMKPRKGQASQGFKLITTREEFVALNNNIDNEHIAQTLVGDQDSEYTVSGFFNFAHELNAIIAFKRSLSNEGFTEKAEVVDPGMFSTALSDLGTSLGAIGPTNFQFRIHKGKLKLLEINPRISSATSIRSAFGYNEAEMAIDYFFYNNHISQPKIRSGSAIRYTEDHIFYDRDTV